MRITSIDAFPVGYIREYPSTFVRSFALVKVQTDAGLAGWGEASDCFGHSDPLVIRQIVEEELKRHLIGEDPLLLEGHMRRLDEGVAEQHESALPPPACPSRAHGPGSRAS